MRLNNGIVKVVVLAIGIVTVSCGNLNRLSLKKVESRHSNIISEVNRNIESCTKPFEEKLDFQSEDSMNNLEVNTIKQTDQSVLVKNAFRSKVAKDYNALIKPVREVIREIPTPKSIAVKGVVAIHSHQETRSSLNPPYFEMMADIIRSFFITLGILMLIAFVVYCFYEFGGPKLKLAIETILGILLVIVIIVEAIIWVVDFIKN